MQAMDKELEEEKPPVKPRRRWIKRAFLGLLALVIILGLLGWAFLPRIAEKVMGDMLAEADLERADFKIREIGWSSAVIESVAMSDGVLRGRSFPRSTTRTC